MKLALVISSLSGGGAERVMATLANAWANEGHEVTLITFAEATNDQFAVVSRVERVALSVAAESKNVIEGFTNNVRRVMALRRAISSRRPDAVVSFMTRTNLLTILSCRGLGIPVIASERSYFGANPLHGIWKRIFRPTYRAAAAIVAQTERGARDLEARLGRPVVVIPNPVENVSGEDAPRASLPTPNIVLAMGRLGKEKGFDLLIEAFSRISSAHPSWALVILGEGPERKALEAQIERSGLSDRISMPGFSDAPAEMVRRARMFVLPSRYEGLPNALMEAMASGLACVSFDCLTGPAELIQQGVNGLLVPPEDSSALAGEMGRLMTDADLRARLGCAATDSMRRYSLPAVMEKWNALFQDLQAPLKNTYPRRSQVMFLIRSFEVGGAERQLATLLIELHRRHWPVCVACFYSRGKLLDPLKAAGIPVFDLAKRGRWSFVPFLWRFRRLLREQRPAVLHGYLPVPNLLALAMRSMFPGMRVVWGVRASHVDFALYGSVNRLVYWLEKNFARKPDLIIVNSNAGFAQRIAEGCQQQKLRLIVNGIDTSKFNFDPQARCRLRTQWNVSEKDILVGVVGRLDPMKDHQTFLHAAAALASEDGNWRFLCVGSGPAAYTRDLMELAENLGLGGVVIWSQARDDIAAVYSAADIVVSSSASGEGFPNVIAEAMACGRPCVVTDVGDSALLVGDSGVVVSARNPGALANGVRSAAERLLRDRPEMERAARARIAEEYSVERLVERTEAALRSLAPEMAS